MRADGAVIARRSRSVRSIASVRSRKASHACNGWTFWHVETKTGLKLIDELRAEIRAGKAG